MAQPADDGFEPADEDKPAAEEKLEPLPESK